MRTIKKIFTRMESHNTLVCCGLDPDVSRLPPEIINLNISKEEKVLSFMKTVIDLTANSVCVYKAQKAFFDILPGGHDVLKEIIDYVHKNHPGLSVIVDCKIGDIDNTMKAYIQNIFGEMKADGVVVNPYMGNDVIEPLAELHEKAIVVLVKTSNPSGAIVQDAILQNGQPLWQYILEVLIAHWNYNNNMIPVLSSTTQVNASELRSIIPVETPILLAGVGAQGGSYADLSKLLNSNKTGVFINSSRGILYPNKLVSWKDDIKEAVINLKNEINKKGGRNE